MRIMVFDVPAERGGALSVLYEFYNEYRLDSKNQYIFVVSKPQLKETTNTRVIRFPWIKKSWMHRLYFDYFIAPKLVNKYKVDRILSLQNISVPRTKVFQSVFVHNALPFSNYKFKFSKNRLLWVYQNILSKSIFRSIKKSNRVIVQTNWMKEKCISQLNIDSEKIEVRFPKIDIKVTKVYKNINKDKIFFYPANAAIYKNHKIIVDACLKLRAEGIENYKVIFTLNGNENKTLEDVHKTVIDNNLPIKFIGSISRTEVFNYYSKAILIFPSFIETVGLPLLEARIHEVPIIASDCTFSHEVLHEYDKVKYFDPFDDNTLYLAMKEKVGEL